MNDKSKKLFDGITGIRDDIVKEAEVYSRPKSKVRVISIAAAACVCIAACGAALSLLGGRAEAPSAENGGTGSDNSGTYMSYAGPVLPLTTADGRGLTAERHITFDFAPYADNSTDCIVFDEYTLRNDTEEDITAEFLYPFCGSFSQLADIMPKISVNGESADTKWLEGAYAGGFQGVLSENGGDDGTTYNLKQPNCFEDYAKRLSEGVNLGPQADADELARRVIVYEVKDCRADEDAGEAPSLGIEYFKGDGSVVVSYGFNGMTMFEDGRIIQGFFIPKEGRINYGQTHCLMVFGGDIQNAELKGFRTMNVEAGNETDSVYGRLVRYETTAGEILEKLTKEYLNMGLEKYYAGSEEGGIVSPEVYCKEAAFALMNYGILSENPVDRYFLESFDFLLSEVNIWRRIMYVGFEATIPKGGSITVSAEMVKHGSYDFGCTESEGRGTVGYDAAVKAGSSLAFDGLKASVEDRGQIDIINQNFGFDLTNGVKTVALGTDGERYYLEVKRK